MSQYHRKQVSTPLDLNITPGASSLGRRLGEAKTDWGRLGLSMLIRVATIALATFIIWRQGGIDSMFVMAAVAIIYAIIILFPLPHCRDSMEFYENGITYKGKPYLFQSTRATFTTSSGTGYFLASTYLYLTGMPKGLNVSYIKNAQEEFTRFYVNTSRYNYGSSYFL